MSSCVRPVENIHVDFRTASTFHDLADNASLIVTGEVTAVGNVIDLSRGNDPKNIYEIGQVYEFQVDQVLKGDRFTTLQVVQVEGFLANKGIFTNQTIQQAKDNFDYVPMKDGRTYLLFLNPLAAYTDNQYYIGDLEPARFDISNPNQVIPESPWQTASRVFPAESLQTIIAQIKPTESTPTAPSQATETPTSFLFTLTPNWNFNRLPSLTPMDITSAHQSTVDWQLPEQINVRETSFISPEEGWVLFDQTRLLKTEDGGQNWIVLQRLEQGLSQLQFVSHLRGWGVAGDGLYHTSDGGQSWQRIYDPQESVVPSRLDFVNESDGYWSLDSGLWRTSDGGVTWTVLRPKAFEDFHYGGVRLTSISFINVSTGWMLYQWCVMPSCISQLFQTTDGGQSFSLVSEAGPGIYGTLDTMRPGHTLYFTNEQQGWIFGGEFNFQQTTDGGKTWSSEHSPEGMIQIGSVRMFNQNQGVASGGSYYAGDQIVIKTSDGGQTWQQIFPMFQPSMPLAFVDSQHGYGIRRIFASPVLLETEDGGKTWTNAAVMPAKVSRLQWIDGITAWAGVPDGPAVDGMVLWRSEDQGQSWTSVAVPAGFNLKNYYFLNSSTGLIWDRFDALSATLDGGQTWQPVQVDMPGIPVPQAACTWLQAGQYALRACPGDPHWKESLSALDIRRFIPLSETTAWAYIQTQARGEMALLKTSDGGMSWTSEILPTEYLYDIAFVDFNHGWAVTQYSLIKTSDGGKTWQQIPPVHFSIPAR
jgi:photosystem II stability/assembly factor-like uncharacterized protein